MVCYKCGATASRYAEPSGIVLAFLALAGPIGSFCAGSCDSCAASHDAKIGDKYFDQKQFRTKAIPGVRSCKV